MDFEVRSAWVWVLALPLVSCEHTPGLLGLELFIFQNWLKTITTQSSTAGRNDRSQNNTDTWRRGDRALHLASQTEHIAGLPSPLVSLWASLFGLHCKRSGLSWKNSHPDSARPRSRCFPPPENCSHWAPTPRVNGYPRASLPGSSHWHRSGLPREEPLLAPTYAHSGRRSGSTQTPGISQRRCQTSTLLSQLPSTPSRCASSATPALRGICLSPFALLVHRLCGVGACLMLTPSQMSVCALMGIFLPISSRGTVCVSFYVPYHPTAPTQSLLIFYMWHCSYANFINTH